MAHTIHDTVARDLRQDGHRAMVARRHGWCPCKHKRCGGSIEEGQCIVLDEGKWVRSDCFTRKYGDDRAVLPRCIANPYTGGWYNSAGRR